MLMRICPSPSHSGDFTLWTKQLGLSWFPFVVQRFSGKDQQKVTGGASLECHPHRFLRCYTELQRAEQLCGLLQCQAGPHLSLTLCFCHNYQELWGAVALCLAIPHLWSHMWLVSGFPGPCCPVLETVFSWWQVEEKGSGCKERCHRRSVRTQHFQP